MTPLQYTALVQAKHRSCAVCSVPVLAASSAVKDAVAAKIVLKQCELAFGDTVRAVGDTDKFGNWTHDNGPELKWQEGHNWEAELELAPGTSTFKVPHHFYHGRLSPH